MFKELSVDNKDQIDNFLAQYSGHILQSFEWGELRAKEGHIVKRYAEILASGKIKAYCQVVYHKLPRWYPSKMRYIGEVWRGPVMSEDFLHKDLMGFLNEIKNLSKDIDPVFIKFE